MQTLCYTQQDSLGASFKRVAHSFLWETVAWSLCSIPSCVCKLPRPGTFGGKVITNRYWWLWGASLPPKGIINFQEVQSKQASKRLFRTSRNGCKLLHKLNCSLILFLKSTQIHSCFQEWQSISHRILLILGKNNIFLLTSPPNFMANKSILLYLYEILLRKYLEIWAVK